MFAIFQILDQMSPTCIACESDYTETNMECNVGKNHYPNVLPSE